MKPKVFVSRPLAEPGLRKLTQFCDVEVWDGADPPSQEELRAAVAPCQALLVVTPSRVDEALLDAAPELRVISANGVGVDNIDLAACRRRGIPVGNTPEVLTDATADLAWALLMAAARRVPEADMLVRGGRWEPFSPTDYWGVDVAGATIGIVGFGRIGQAVAKRAAGFGMDILFWNRSPRPDAAREFGVQQVDLDELLRRSDFVSLHCPLTEETRGLISREKLALMKSNTILVNTARGAVVDQAALVDALRSRQILAAGLDVFEVEPLLAGDPLCELSNVVMMPHVGSATEKTRGRMSLAAADNILAALRGEPMPYPVV